MFSDRVPNFKGYRESLSIENRKIYESYQYLIARWVRLESWKGNSEFINIDWKGKANLVYLSSSYAFLRI